jgi:tetraprenyl-beta-curcumene synthase
VFVQERRARLSDPQTEGRSHRPPPISRRQFRTLGQAAARELAWGLPAVAREVRAWRAMAMAIPAGAIRDDALSSLARKRGHTDGAALFCILPRSREPTLLRLLVAYEIMWDFLDSVNEHGAAEGQANGRQLHLALVDALDPDAALPDYYLHHPWKNDGGYLNTLVKTCQGACSELRSYDAVRPLVAQEARRAQVLAINHDPDPIRRDTALRAWSGREFPGGHDASWYELTGAASASLTIHALLALAANVQVSSTEITCVRQAYFPWISAATTMLDSYVDQAEDSESGDHSYVGHYPSTGLAIQRVGLLVRRSLAEASQLPDGDRHIVIVASMIAMYLSKDSAWTPATRRDTRRLLATAGPLASALLPILRLWRIAYAQRST